MAMFRAGYLLILLLLCGCAVTAIAPEQLRTIRSVAVISVLGDKFTVKKIGITVFGNDEKEMPIDAWGIDPFVVNKVRSLLAGRFDVRPLAYRRSADANDTTPVRLVESVRAQAGSADVDAYIVVSKYSGLFGSSNQSLSGLGIVQTSGLMASVYLYALYEVTVVDARNLAVAASARALQLNQTLRTLSISGPSRELDESWMPATLDAAQNIRLKNAAAELLERHLPSTIESLKLLQ